MTAITTWYTYPAQPPSFVTFMLQCPPVLKSFLAIQQMEAENMNSYSCRNSHIRCDVVLIPRTIMLSSLRQHLFQAVYSIVQASFFIHIKQTCFSLDSCTVKFNPDPLHHVILNEEERKMSYYLGRYYVDIRSPCKYQKNIFICCLVNMPHCMFSKTKGLIGVRLFSISSSYIDHSGTEAPKTNCECMNNQQKITQQIQPSK